MILPKVSNAWFFGTFLTLVAITTVAGLEWKAVSTQEERTAQIDWQAAREDATLVSYVVPKGERDPLADILQKEGWFAFPIRWGLQRRSSAVMEWVPRSNEGGGSF